MRLIEGDDPLEGTRRLRAGLSQMPTASLQQRRHVSYLRTLAVGALQVGEIADAAEAIEETLQKSDRNEDRWSVAELLRIKGEILLSKGREPEAETLFQQSLSWSRRQGALSWELRTAMSLASMKHAQGYAAEARALLGPVYSRFSEGFGTIDLIRAAELLHMFEASARRSSKR